MQKQEKLCTWVCLPLAWQKSVCFIFHSGQRWEGEVERGCMFFYVGVGGSKMQRTGWEGASKPGEEVPGPPLQPCSHENQSGASVWCEPQIKETKQRMTAGRYGKMGHKQTGRLMGEADKKKCWGMKRCQRRTGIRYLKKTGRESVQTWKEEE